MVIPHTYSNCKKDVLVRNKFWIERQWHTVAPYRTGEMPISLIYLYLYWFSAR